MRRLPATIIICALFLASLIAPCCLGQSYLIKDGQPRAEIIIPEKPARMVTIAANELQEYLFKITGARLLITNKPAGGGVVAIFVGKGAGTDALKITDDGLKDGAFRIVSGTNWLALVGHDGDFTPREPYLNGRTDQPRLMAEWDRLTGQKWAFPYGSLFKLQNRELNIWETDQRGSLNAVHEFLRRLGVRWYLPGELGEIVPKMATIELPVVDSTVRPDFALRYPMQYGERFSMASRDEIFWQLRLGLNQVPDGTGFEGGHGITNVHSRQETKVAHPEYFALWSGKRAIDHHGGGGAPCLSSEGLFEQNVAYVRKVYDIFDAPMVSVMPQDGYVTLCQCDLCKGKDTPERGWDGQLSDYVWGYVDRVAREVYKTHPNRKIICYAYGAYALPPAKLDKLSPNLVVGITQGRSQFSNAQTRQAAQALRKAWREKLPGADARIVIGEYYLHGREKSPYAGMPVYFTHAIAQDLRSLKGVSLGDFIEVYRDSNNLSTLATNHLNLYITSRFWWDSSQDLDAMLEEYYTSFYGPARGEMKAFIEYSEANWMDMPRSADKIGRVFDLLHAAEAKAPPDSVYAKRIALIAGYMKPMVALQQQLLKKRDNVPTIRITHGGAADIVMDGKLDDKIWEPRGGLSLKDLQTGKPPISPTTFKAVWVDKSLYLGITCVDRDTTKLNIGSTKNGDSNIWNGDTIELLIETQTHAYYQIAISPSGAMIAADRKNGIDTHWVSGVEVASHIDNGYWSLEVRIPAAGDLQEEVDPMHGVTGHRPSSTYPWYINVCRQRIRAESSEYSAFSPTGKANFHDPMKFAALFVK